MQQHKRRCFSEHRLLQCKALYGGSRLYAPPYISVRQYAIMNVDQPLSAKQVSTIWGLVKKWEPVPPAPP